ncbi:hypothetical protein [Siculibacillus lacustris]|nr:hypothetical protein [Siculibacillus lacustris]
MSRNLVSAVAAILVIAVAVLGYQLYRERHRPEGVEIRVDDHGLTIEKR